MNFEPLDVLEVVAELLDETLHRHHDPTVRVPCNRSRLRAPVPPEPDPRKAPFAYLQPPKVTELYGWRGDDGLPMVTVARDMRPACRLLDGLCLHPEEPACRDLCPKRQNGPPPQQEPPRRLPCSATSGTFR